MNWFETYEKPRLDPNTAAGRISKINKHILPIIGEKRINDVTVSDVQRMKSMLNSASMGKRVTTGQLQFGLTLLHTAVSEGKMLTPAGASHPALNLMIINNLHHFFRQNHCRYCQPLCA